MIIMRREEAEDLSRESDETRHPILDAWYCGIINGQIRKAAKRGQEKVKIRFSAKSFVATHRRRFIELYSREGYEVYFRPNYVHIDPTIWDMIINWGKKTDKNT